MNTERRQQLRLPVSMKVDLDEGSPLAFGYAKNISLEGMAVSCEVLLGEPDFPETNTDIRIKFILPGSETALSVSATVVHIQGRDPLVLGLRFKNLSELGQKEIKNYLLTARLDAQGELFS